jgi:diaminohydroxyphosphoribosylaminopyrimidine deaminase / 5-amino-6-(5-phosphoribosylamino)uracil reductase
MIVTLEPCNHFGRTGPCTGAILATPAREVWYGLPDPNLAATGGVQRLEAAGLDVYPLSMLDHPQTPDLLHKVTRQLAPFSTRVLLGRPFVTVKQALDLSGSMIPPLGQKTFTSPTSLRLAHQLRRRADAILTGSGTVIADRPEFTVRHVSDIAGKERILCVFDRRGRIDAEYLAGAKNRGFRPHIAGEIQETLRLLAAEGCNEVLVEAGPGLTASFHQAGLWDEWVLIEKMPLGQSDRITVTNRNSP